MKKLRKDGLRIAMAAARLTGVDGEITMTRRPEWGVLPARVRMEAMP